LTIADPTCAIRPGDFTVVARAGMSRIVPAVARSTPFRRATDLASSMTTRLWENSRVGVTHLGVTDMASARMSAGAGRHPVKPGRC
jgi:hypothetical protein